MSKKQDIPEDCVSCPYHNYCKHESKALQLNHNVVFCTLSSINMIVNKSTEICEFEIPIAFI